MADLLCVATCRIPNRHRDGCVADCLGCLPGRKADGVNLCQHHVDRLTIDPIELATLHSELELVIMRTGSSGEKVSGTGAEPPAPRDRVVEVRTEIRHTLASWCRLIGEERGHQLPADEVSAMGAFVAKHATWLAAHSAAGEVSDELGSLRRRAWSIAYPTGTKVVTVGPCPRSVPIDEDVERDCSGTLRAIVRPADQFLPSEVVCSADPEHRWDSTQWRQLDRLVARRAA